MRYAELQVTTNFSFLKGASSAGELFETAKALGIEALAVVDRNSLAGIVRAYVASQETGVRLIVGCRLDLRDGSALLVYPKDRAAYGRLCRLISVGKGRAGKGECDLGWEDVEAFNEGLLAILVPDMPDETTAAQLRKIKTIFSDRCFLSLALRRRPNDYIRLHSLANMAVRYGVPAVVTNDVLYHDRSRRKLQDVLTCIRHNCTIDDVGFKRERHADRYLKSPQEMARLFADYPEALRRSAEIADRCTFSLSELRYQYPEERVLKGMSPMEALKRYTWEGAKARYPEGVPDKVMALLKHELKLIEQLDYAPYFLTVHAIVRQARLIGILCQGRGSAANSAVCYVLGVTSIDPERNDLLFERFISAERNEPPDIDIDFEHERREEIIQWIYESYGRDRAALTAVVTRYRAKGAIRDVGKALGLPADLTKTLSSEAWGWRRKGLTLEEIGGLGINVKDRRVRLTLELAEQLMGFPRHLSQHPGGFVLTHDRLDELVPIEPARMENREVIEWDKDDIDVLRMMKVDVLALGMLTCIRKSLDLLQEHKGHHFDLATIPAEDPRVYRMIQRADTLGVFQIESRAQMSMLPRLRPQTFYDLVIEVAIVRPGPIQGDMVHPYLNRRMGKEPVQYPTPQLEAVLSKTLGVPLFQEQAMKISVVCAGFTPGEADQLRRSMATFKFTGGVSKFKDKLISGMIANGYTEEFAERIFGQLQGFGSYGFPESHAASFAILAYASCWIKYWHLDAFTCALLNSQPMGFYSPASIVRSAVEHGVEVRPPCVNASRWDCTLEPAQREGPFAVRLGLRQIKGMNNAHAATIVTARADQPFRSVDDMWRRAKVPVSCLTLLAKADAFLPSLGLARQDALWAIKALQDEPLPLFAALAKADNTPAPEVVEPVVKLKRMTEGGEVVQDYGFLGLSLRNHPVHFLRDDLRRREIITCREAMNAKDGKYVRTAGLVITRQQPGSASGVVFVTAEDETSILNVIIWPKVFEACRRAAVGGQFLLFTGQIQREGEVVHLIARSITDLSHELATIDQRHGALSVPHTAADEFRGGGPGIDRRIGNLEIKSRNFH